MDAPIPCAPGPGVLPFFSDSGPYYKWFSGNPIGTGAQTAAETRAVTSAIERGLARHGRRAQDVDGVLGFSQGTMAASLLLWLARGGDARWAGLRFGVMLCGGCRADVVGMIGGQKLEVPTVHLHGLEDPYLRSSRLLVECFREDSVVVMEFAGGHHCPTGERDVEKLASLVLEASEGRPRRWMGRGVVPEVFGEVGENNLRSPIQV